MQTSAAESSSNARKSSTANSPLCRSTCHSTNSAPARAHNRCHAPMLASWSCPDTMTRLPATSPAHACAKVFKFCVVDGPKVSVSAGTPSKRPGPRRKSRSRRTVAPCWRGKNTPAAQTPRPRHNSRRRSQKTRTAPATPRQTRGNSRAQSRGRGAGRLADSSAAGGGGGREISRKFNPNARPHARPLRAIIARPWR